MAFLPIPLALPPAMKSLSSTTLRRPSGLCETGFDLFRLTRSKEIVDICPNTLRHYHKHGLPFYSRKGERAVYVSISDLEKFLKASLVAPKSNVKV